MNGWTSSRTVMDNADDAMVAYVLDAEGSLENGQEVVF